MKRKLRKAAFYISVALVTLVFLIPVTLVREALFPFGRSLRVAIPGAATVSQWVSSSFLCFSPWPLDSSHSSSRPAASRRNGGLSSAIALLADWLEERFNSGGSPARRRLHHRSEQDGREDRECPRFGQTLRRHSGTRSAATLAGIGDSGDDEAGLSQRQWIGDAQRRRREDRSSPRLQHSAGHSSSHRSRRVERPRRGGRSGRARPEAPAGLVLFRAIGTKLARFEPPTEDVGLPELAGLFDTWIGLTTLGVGLVGLVAPGGAGPLVPLLEGLVLARRV